METNLTRGNVTGVLVRFALPLFAANLLQSLYSLVDMAVMGRFLGSPGLAALSSSATICYVCLLYTSCKNMSAFSIPRAGYTRYSTGICCFTAASPSPLTARS